MPRKGRGGARQGTTGTAYGQRTDLNQPISTVPGQEYGMAKQQADAQRAIPMAASPVAAAPAQPQQPQQPQGQRPSMPQPGTMPHLDPTNRPDEPVTAGLPFGPGAGPEAISRPAPRISQQFSQLAELSGTAIDLASTARSMGL